ncbi:MAG: hypothetical protein ACT4OQ_12605 [Chloroflexota bacterium]
MRNEVLEKLDILAGNWKLTLTNAWFLDSLDVEVEGWATFEWLFDAFIVWRWETGGEQPGTLVLGRSDARDEFKVLGHDDRGICRVFEMTFGDGQWTMSREDPDFHQRFLATVEHDRILMSVEASEDAGETWRKDFDLIFERTDQPSQATATSSA